MKSAHKRKKMRKLCRVDDVRRSVIGQFETRLECGRFNLIIAPWWNRLALWDDSWSTIIKLSRKVPRFKQLTI